MNNDEVFEELEEILKKFNIAIKYGRGHFTGGLCRFNNTQYMYLNRAKDTDNHITLIVSELKNFDLNDVKLSSTLENLLRESEKK
jgi:hypothetical protein